MCNDSWDIYMYIYIYVMIHTIYIYIYIYIYTCIIYICLRTENRSRKTHVFEYRDCGVGWGGHVNVPCTSYMKYCHAADISGIVYYVTCCYAADGVGWGGVGWGGMLTFLVLRTWNIATLLRSLGSFTTLHVATLLMGWGGVGWGGMVTLLVLRTWYIAMLLRSLGSFTTLHVATLLLGWGGVGGAC